MSGPLTRPGDAAGDSPVRIGAGTPASGSGDVVGPASSTDNFFALADGTTGKLIKFSEHPLDANDNELFKVASVASAVNEITISNAATLGPPIIAATGSDANIGLWLKPKGAGVLYLGDGTAGIDYELRFIGETTEGVLRWMEDEDYFKFMDSVLLNTTRRLYIYDATSYLYGTSAGNIVLSGATTTNVGTDGGTTTVGVAGDVILGSNGNDVYPPVDNVTDLGIAANRYRSLPLAGKITYYNSIVTVANGVPSELWQVNSTGLAAPQVAKAMYTPTAAGMFRVSVVMTLTTPATTSSVLAGTTAGQQGVSVTFATGDGSTAVTQTIPLTTQAGTAIVNTSAANVVGTTLIGHAVIYAAASAMTYDAGYTSVGATGMQYSLRIRLEALG